MQETIGKRIAMLRQKNGWTQASLANRLAMSRVAISHIEMDLTTPSERTITLMAGLFKVSPFDLVDETTYPRGKAERLPQLANCYTVLELQLALLKNDAEWLQRIDNPAAKHNCLQITVNNWLVRLDDWGSNCFDEHERDILAEINYILDELKSQLDYFSG